MKGSCASLKELWGFLSASWLRFLGRAVLQRSSSVGGSSVKQRPLHGPWGLALFPCSKATWPCMSPGEEELGGDNQCSRVTRGLEQPGTAAGAGLPSACLPPWPPSSSTSPEPAFALDPGGFVFFSCAGAEASPGSPYPAPPAPGLSITAWHRPALPSPATRGTSLELRQCSKTSSLFKSPFG